MQKGDVCTLISSVHKYFMWSVYQVWIT